MPLIGFLAVLLLAASVYVAAERRAAQEAAAAAIALEAPRARWTARILGDVTPIDVEERTAIVVRLGIVGSEWAIATLEAALADEPDARVREAVWQTLVAARTQDAIPS